MKKPGKHPSKPHGQKPNTRQPSSKPQAAKGSGPPNVTSHQDFPQLMLPPQPAKTPKMSEEDNGEAKGTSLHPAKIASGGVPVPPPPGNFGTAQQFRMGDTASSAPTPKSLKAVEQEVSFPKDSQKDSKDMENTEVGQLACHLEQMILSGSLQLPEHLQSAVQNLKDTEQPKSASMFSLENQRRKWQKKLQQNQEKLTFSQNAWATFFSDVTKHVAQKEEQYLAIRASSEQAIAEAQAKLQEIAQSMQDQIPKDSCIKGLTSGNADPCVHLTQRLKDSVATLQHEAHKIASDASVLPISPEAPAPSAATGPSPNDAVEVTSDTPVSVTSDQEDGPAWEPVVRPRSRSRQEQAEHGTNKSRPARTRKNRAGNQQHVQKQTKK